MNNKQELLAPASDVKSFYVACFRGADAIYMGLEKFNARSMAKNFTLEEYIDCIKYAHRLGKKVYLTLNTIIFSEEVKEALNLIYELYKVGLDAVILQDIGLATKIHEIFPDLSMHASTQMSVYSLEQVNFLKSLGFTRVVLARELTINEIEYICKNTDLEIEVFIHGALCVSLSGQCMLSSTIGARSANRGVCAQPCRMKYTLINHTQNKVIAKNQYLLSKKDIFGIEMIKKLKAAGVYSFKIEGRNRTLEYIGCAVSKYRKALDNKAIKQKDKKDLTQVFIRETKSLGYLNGVEYKKSITKISPKNTGIYLGKVLDKVGKFIKIKLNDNINLHDGFEIYNSTTYEKEYSSIVTCIKNNDNKIINDNLKLNVNDTVWLGDVNKSVSKNSLVYKTSDHKLNEEYSKYETLKPKCDVKVTILNNKKIKATTLLLNKESVETIIDYIPEKSINTCITFKDIVSNFNKTKDEAIDFNNIEVDIDKTCNLYVKVSKLNELRKCHIKNIITSLDNLLNERRNINFKSIKEKIDNIEKGFKKEKGKNYTNTKSLFIYKYDKTKDYNLKDYSMVYILIEDFIANKQQIFNSFKNLNTSLFVAIPNYTGKKVCEYINKNLEELVKSGVSGILLGSFEHINQALYLKEKYKIKLVADYYFNIANIHSAYFFKSLGFDIITPSPEIDSANLEKIKSIIDIQVVDNLITVMTSRYCMIGAFDQNRDTALDKCSKPCITNNFILKDSFNEKIYIVPDYYDCIVRLVKKKNISIENNKYSIRKCII